MDIKQVIVMRTDLNRRKGKMIAQGAHASMMFIVKRLKRDNHEIFPGSGPYPFQAMDVYPGLTAVELAWVEGNFKKICVSVSSEADLLRIHQAANDLYLESHLCTDNGLTEFNGIPTNTCIAIGPDDAEKIDKITGHLTLL